MPTKDRKENEQAWKLLESGEPSKLFSPSDDLSNGVYRGIEYVDEEGGVFKHPKLGGDIPKRSLNKKRYALDLKKKYKDIWGIRGKAKVIAMNEGLSVSSIQKYFKEFP